MDVMKFIDKAVSRGLVKNLVIKESGFSRATSKNY